MDFLDDLSEYEQRHLYKVHHGEFVNVDIVPAAVSVLVARGYVEAVPTLSFPITPPRYTFRLTTAGHALLAKIRLHQYP